MHQGARRHREPRGQLTGRTRVGGRLHAALNIGRPKPVRRKHAKVYRLVTWKPIGDIHQ
jgi:hypothetical protein